MRSFKLSEVPQLCTNSHICLAVCASTEAAAPSPRPKEPSSECCSAEFPTETERSAEDCAVKVSDEPCSETPFCCSRAIIAAVVPLESAWNAAVAAADWEGAASHTSRKYSLRRHSFNSLTVSVPLTFLFAFEGNLECNALSALERRQCRCVRARSE